MYSFGPIPKQKRSGRIIGTHQKIDRVARRHLATHLQPERHFPDIQTILHFEGSRGPDGIKMKSPGIDEPRHFVDPKNIRIDDDLLVAIRDHIKNLTNALIADDMIRAGFEAAWLAHAVTDGLTPAHHEPFDEQIKSLKSADQEMSKFMSRALMTGNGSGRKFVENNWKYWGAKGIMTTHTLFEGGVATAAKPLAFNGAFVNEDDFTHLREVGFEKLYVAMIEDIDTLKMYEQFKSDGWTRKLAVQTTKTLLPTVIRAVTLAWYEAYTRALGRTA